MMSLSAFKEVPGRFDVDANNEPIIPIEAIS
jgi:hypothetical protein